MPMPSFRNLDRVRRAAFKKAVAAALVRREWDEFEAMASELGLPVPERAYRLGRVAAVDGALGEAHDDQLDVLAGIVLPADFDLDWEQRDPWEAGLFRLFLSHAHQDRDSVGNVARALVNSGIHAFVAHDDIAVQAEWAHVIEYALDTADALVAFVSEPSTSSYWCNQEIGWALGRHQLVVSVGLGHAPVGFTGRLQAMRANNEPAELAEGIRRLLVDRVETAETFTLAYLNLFEESDSWEIARARATVLDDLHWNGSTLTRLAEAIRCNRKLTEAWRVPGRVRELFRRYGFETDAEVTEYLRDQRR